MANRADTALQWALSQVGKNQKPRAHLSGRFVQQAYRSAGIQIPHSTVGQLVHLRNNLIGRMSLAPGDIVFPDARTSGLYVGNGFMATVDAKGKVLTKPITKFWKAARVETPGGGAGLSLARAGETKPKIRSQFTQLGHTGHEGT